MATRELRQQRAFRIAQLIALDGIQPDATEDAARYEVHAKLRAAAVAVLSDIDSALRRIEGGSYGRCLGCGQPMSLRRLTALPMAPLCGSCQRLAETTPPEARDRSVSSRVA